MKIFNKNVEVRHWLQDYGFDKESHTVLGQPCQFEKCIPSESGLYSIWVGVDFKWNNATKQYEPIEAFNDCFGNYAFG